jgi:hypothetical protein
MFKLLLGHTRAKTKNTRAKQLEIMKT